MNRKSETPNPNKALKTNLKQAEAKCNIEVAKTSNTYYAALLSLVWFW